VGFAGSSTHLKGNNLAGPRRALSSLSGIPNTGQRAKQMRGGKGGEMRTEVLGYGRGRL
jgi:hypothetical protein